MGGPSFTKEELREELQHFGKTILSAQLKQIISEQFATLRATGTPLDGCTEDAPLNSISEVGRNQGSVAITAARGTINRAGVPSGHAGARDGRDMGWLNFALNRGNWTQTMSTLQRAVKPRRPTWLNSTPYHRSDQQSFSQVVQDVEHLSPEEQAWARAYSLNSNVSRQSRRQGGGSFQTSVIAEANRRHSQVGHSRHSQVAEASHSLQRLGASGTASRDNLSFAGGRASIRQGNQRSTLSQHSRSLEKGLDVAGSMPSRVKFQEGGGENDIDEEQLLLGPLPAVTLRPSLSLVNPPDSARDLVSNSSESSGDFMTQRKKPCTCRGFVRSQYFDYCAAIIAVLGSVIIGVQTNYMASHSEEDIPLVFFINQSIFSVIFVCEMVIRLVFNNPNDYDWEHRWGWRYFLFDSIVIGMELIREIAHYSFAFTGHRHRVNFSVLPLRLWRFTIIVPSRELHQLGVSFMESFRYLICAMMIITIMSFVSGIFFTEYVIFLKHWHPALELEDEQRRDLDRHFGTLPRAMIALFQVVSDGIHWHDLADPLIASYSEWVVLPFIIYAALAIYSLMNIIVGIFVDSAVRTADTDNKVSLIQEMHAMFQLADEDGSGTLSWDEFERFLDHPQMCKLLRAIDLDQDHAKQLFRLLDEDSSGNHEINHKTFVNRCMRFHGAAKAVDLAAFMHEYQRTMKIVMDILEDMEQFMSVGPSNAA